MDDSKVFEDKFLFCIACGREFPFEASEQYFFHERGYQDPKRCPECRAKKRARLNPGKEVRDDQSDINP